MGRIIGSPESVWSKVESATLCLFIVFLLFVGCDSSSAGDDTPQQSSSQMFFKESSAALTTSEALHRSIHWHYRIAFAGFKTPCTHNRNFPISKNWCLLIWHNRPDASVHSIIILCHLIQDTKDFFLIFPQCTLSPHSGLSIWSQAAFLDKVHHVYWAHSGGEKSCRVN